MKKENHFQKASVGFWYKNWVWKSKNALFWWLGALSFCQIWKNLGSHECGPKGLSNFGCLPWKCSPELLYPLCTQNLFEKQTYNHVIVYYLVLSHFFQTISLLEDYSVVILLCHQKMKTKTCFPQYMCLFLRKENSILKNSYKWYQRFLLFLLLQESIYWHQPKMGTLQTRKGSLRSTKKADTQPTASTTQQAS